MTHLPNRTRLALAALSALGLNGAAQAQLVINDKLTGAASSYDWKALNGACLTAGNNTGSIPACSGLAYYNGKTLVGGTSGRLPDNVGFGALRLTNGDTATGGSNGDNQTGAVVSNFTFPTNAGIQVTWTSVTYGGDNLNGTGADGISFFLADGAYDPSVGGLGGSLGYSCSNGNGVYDGVVGGYIGVGIDEYGNFSNKSDNTDTGDSVAGLHPKRISVRGAGYTAASWLRSSASGYAKYYPTSLTAAQLQAAVQNTCKTGYVWDYRNTASVKQTSNQLAYNYPLIFKSDLPSTVSIANQEGVSSPLRGSALPITYALKITADGLMDFSYKVGSGSAQNVIVQQQITDSNGPLPASFRFGFSSGTGGGNNVHEITCFKAAPASQSNSSAGSNQQSSRTDTTTQVFLAYYHTQNWWGSLTAQKLSYDASLNGGTLSISPNIDWDAGCELTGGTCQSTNTDAGSAQDPTQRVILTSSVGLLNTSTGVPFRYGNLTVAQQLAITLGDVLPSANRVNFLRGDRTKEVPQSKGIFRTRTSVLGDIVDSSPTWVGPPSAPYTGTFKDKLVATAAPEAASYSAFAAGSAAGRTNIVYVGANDGMLHGFRAGTYTNGALGGTNDGQEMIAYVPAQVVSTIHSLNPSLDFSATGYSHNFYADATPATGDLYYSGAWHTWLVSGLGPGGHATGPIGDNSSTVPTTLPLTPASSLFALDVTDPSRFSESNAASLVLGEWSSSSLTCVNLPVACGSYLGQTYGTPAIRRLHDGNWAVLFGNGLNSASGSAGLFIMHVDSTSGARTFRYLDTGAGTSGGVRNGIVSVTPADLDGDHVTDYVYAGDIQGHVWRFDLTSTNPGNWSAGSTPLFTTPAGQPISTRVTVSGTPTSNLTSAGLQKVIVAFGTGQKLPLTLTSDESFASASQSLYGIWDWNMAAWNASATDTKYDSLAAPQTVDSSKLQVQTVTATLPGSADVSGYRILSSTPICWKGSTACTPSTSNTQFGWTLALPATKEQVVYNPVTAYGMFIVNTTIPAAPAALTCDSVPASGYTMAVSLATGGAATGAPFFQDASGSFSTPGIGGVGANGTGSSSVMIYDNKAFLVQQTTDGSGTALKTNPTGGVGARLNWTKVR